MASIILINGYGIPDDLDYDCLGDMLIPEVSDIDFCGLRISFKLRIPSDSWVKKYIDVPWFPLEWLTNPESKPLNPEYLNQKLSRKLTTLEELKEGYQKLEKEIQKVTSEINIIQKSLGKGD